jgi:hypothetical protein
MTVLLSLLVLCVCHIIATENVASSRLVNHSNVKGIEVLNTYAAFRVIPITSLSSQIFRDKEIIPIMTRFDWVIYGYGHVYCINNSQTSNPQTILYRPFLFTLSNVSKALSYFDEIPKLQSKFEVRSIVFAGSDDRLSNVWPTIQLLLDSGKFSHIWYEAKDIHTPDVHTIPMGLTPYYLIEARFEVVARAIATAASTPKLHLVCAAWGRFSPFLDEKLPMRQKLSAFVSKSDWISRVRWAPSDYWLHLPSYSFSLTPEGMGVQSPKLFECLLVRTIPVTNRHPAAEDLQRMGFPIVIVDSWEEVTASFLRDQLAAMDVNASRWEHVRKMITIDGIMDLVRHGFYSQLQTHTT